MNLTKQTEEFMQTWREAQQKMWDGWLKTIQGLGQAQSNEIWTKTLETWEKSVNNSLDMQKQWTQQITENAALTKGAPNEMIEWSKQTQQMSQNWLDAQRQMWQGWFDIIRKVDPSAMPETWNKEGQKILQSWQESTQKMMEAQSKLANMWATNQPQNQ